jgi:hypothetical protein
VERELEQEELLVREPRVVGRAGVVPRDQRGVVEVGGRVMERAQRLDERRQALRSPHVGRHGLGIGADETLDRRPRGARDEARRHPRQLRVARRDTYLHLVLAVEPRRIGMRHREHAAVRVHEPREPKARAPREALREAVSRLEPDAAQDADTPAALVLRRLERDLDETPTPAPAARRGDHPDHHVPRPG